MRPERDDWRPPDAARDEAGRGGASRRWWWLLVVAAALAVVGVFVWGHGEDEPGAVVDTPELEPLQPGIETGELTIGGRPAAPLLEEGDLAGRSGEEVIGTVMPIGAIVAERLYWVGERERGILVVEREGEETLVTDEDVLTFRGTLRPLDDDVLGFVWDHEMEEWLEHQGVYVDVEELVAEPGARGP